MNRRQQHYLLGISVVVIFAVTGGCGDVDNAARGSDTVEDRVDSLPEPPQEFVQYEFDATDSERAALERLFGQVRKQLDATHIAGSVYRFSVAGADARYLLVLISPPSPVRLFALGEGVGSAGVSRPWSTGVEFHPSRPSLNIERIADFDGDSVPDVAYCTWPSDTGTAGSLHAVGYREDTWYRIGEQLSALPDGCTL